MAVDLERKYTDQLHAGLFGGGRLDSALQRILHLGRTNDRRRSEKKALDRASDSVSNVSVAKSDLSSSGDGGSYFGSVAKSDSSWVGVESARFKIA